MSATEAMKKMSLDAGTRVLSHAAPILASVPPLRHLAASAGGAWVHQAQKRARANSAKPIDVTADQEAMVRALLHMMERGLGRQISAAARKAIMRNLLQGILIEKGHRAAIDRFHLEHDEYPPGFLTISPGKACNLQCTGCYADSGSCADKLDWSDLDRIVGEAEEQWGVRLFVISGGEPMVYRSDGKGILDLAEKYPDCYFMMYTNGTLIDEATAERLAALGNLTPAISVEGWRGRTDARRGAGVFDRVLATMARLREAGVPFGISLTATRDNAEEILSDEFIDFFFVKQQALYGWIFQYMPIGRSFTLDLMPTAAQRVWMWRRTWEIIRTRRLFLADFWNSATASQGCVAAGRARGGGYFYIDWNGAVSPCVFVPYSPVNIREAYAQGKTLTDVWADPFFAGIRSWQATYAKDGGNWLAPCINRDHHAELGRLLAQHEPNPTDANAQEALLDPDYAEGLDEYGAAYSALTNPIWQRSYRRPIGHAADSSERQIRRVP